MNVYRIFRGLLTDAIWHLPVARRLAARRRIEAIADHWALALKIRYGAEAVYRCRIKMVACAQGAPGLRALIWTKVYQRLHPPAIRRDRGKAQ